MLVVEDQFQLIFVVLFFFGYVYIFISYYFAKHTSPTPTHITNNTTINTEKSIYLSSHVDFLEKFQMPKLLPGERHDSPRVARLTKF
jgi:hypothetical protein